MARRGFTIRTSSPAGEYNPCYMSNLYGASWDVAWNTCIYGQPTSVGADVLANCTGYAQGRALEIYNELLHYNPSRLHQHPFTPFNANAGEWLDIAIANGFQISQKAVAGAIAVWSEDNEAGHVAVVEYVQQGIAHLTQSAWDGYGGSDFGDGTMLATGGLQSWMAGRSYHFLGFILNPAVSRRGAPVPSEFLMFLRNPNNDDI